MLKELDSFPNTCIAYGLLLTILVSFKKLKLIKYYLRSTMSQQKIKWNNNIINWKEHVKKINYKYLINNFSYQKARKFDL